MVIPQLTTFDPEGKGQLIQGIDFDTNKFEKGKDSDFSHYILPINSCIVGVQFDNLCSRMVLVSSLLLRNVRTVG